MSSASTSNLAFSHDNESLVDRKRSSRACDHCRRMKSKCKRGQNPNKPCVSCEAAGTDCTYEGPTFKRGPPKGYILAIEHRLRQVESLLGTVIGSRDPRAQELIAELKADELAKDIIHRVESGPFGPTGRASLRGSSQEALMAAMSQPAETLSNRGRESRVMRENVSVTVSQDHAASPTLEWQDNLLTLLEHRDRPAANLLQISFPLSDSRTSLELTPPCSLERERSTAAVGKLSVDENDQYHFHDESSGMPMLNRTSERSDSRNRGGIWRSLEQQVETRKDDFEESLETKLPPLSEQEFLIELYFTYVHPFLPVVHKTSFMAAFKERRFSSVNERDDDIAMDNTPGDMPKYKEKISNLLLLSMFALASRYNEPERERAKLQKGQIWGAGFDYFTSARQILDVVFRKSSITVCQSVVLLAFREFGMGYLEQSWIYTGIAIRMAQSLGLHRDADKWRRLNIDVFSSVQKEERKLVWWSLFIIEKYISCALGRPIAITEGNYDTKLPEVIDGGTFATEDEEIWKPHQSVRPELPYKAAKGNAISCLRACASLSIIVGRIVEKLYSLRLNSSQRHIAAYNELQKTLDRWYTDLPNTLTLEHNDVASPHVYMLHLQFWSTVILLRRKFIPLGSMVTAGESSTVRTGSSSTTALDLCQDAASQVSTIATSMMELHSLAATCPFFASYLFTSGIVHIATLSKQPSMVAAEVGAAQVMMALQSMENVWQIASRNWELLNGVKDRIDEARSSPSHHTYSPRLRRKLGAGSGQEDKTGRQGEKPSASAAEPSQVDSSLWMAYLLGLDIPQSKPAPAATPNMATAPIFTQGSVKGVMMMDEQPDGAGASDYFGSVVESYPDPNIFSTFDGYDFHSFTPWDSFQ